MEGGLLRRFIAAGACWSLPASSGGSVCHSHADTVLGSALLGNNVHMVCSIGCKGLEELLLRVWLVRPQMYTYYLRPVLVGHEATLTGGAAEEAAR